MELNNNVDIRVSNFIPFFYLKLILIVLILTGSAFGQKLSSQKDAVDRTNPINITLPTTMQPSINKALLDKKIDPATYILGPGDVISIFTWGSFQGQYQLTVSPEGMLLIPDIGPIEVAGLTLSDARTKIATEIQGRFRNVESIVSLVDLRTFKVFIGGAVTTPGAYPATAATRVSEVIDMAGGFLGEDKDKDKSMGVLPTWKESEKRPSKRGIKVSRQNGATLSADILRFDLTGNPEFNPLLQDGDEIFVPVKQQLINVYGIFGAVRNPGYFEYSARDSLKDIISLGHGLTIDADSHKVEIVRFQSDNKTTQSIDIDLSSDNWNIPLNSDDRVYIKPIENYHEKFQVYLNGEFRFPGFYAITEDSTMLTEVVARAGGLTDMASLDEAEMTRASSEEIVDPEFERLKKMDVKDMSESEYEYFKIKARSRVGRVAVDFKGIFIDYNLSKDIPLRDGDVISVPRKRQVVSVTGEVANPGFQTYVAGNDYEYYVKMAGGYSDRAGRGNISVVKGSGGEWKKPRKGRALDAGDTILVPEKKKHNYLGIFKDTAVFIGNLATIYLVIRQASQ